MSRIKPNNGSPPDKYYSGTCDECGYDLVGRAPSVVRDRRSGASWAPDGIHDNIQRFFCPECRNIIAATPKHGNAGADVDG